MSYEGVTLTWQRSSQAVLLLTNSYTSIQLLRSQVLSPIILAFSSTTHKVQGKTIAYPQKVAVDLRSIFRGGQNQAYVMLGRCEKLSQLYLIGDLPESKIKTDKEALEQLAKLKAKAKANQPIWEKQYKDSVKVFYLNIHSLKDKLEDIVADPVLAFGDLLIFGETWLEEHETLSLEAVLPNYNYKDCYLKEYKVHLNNRGRGKGIAAFYKEDKFLVSRSFSDELLQVTVFETDNICVIALYRSSSDKYIGNVLANLIPDTGSCIIIGDINICSRTATNHSLFKLLRRKGFHLLVSEATHFLGSAIDQVWLRTSTDVAEVPTTALYPSYYTAKDHDGILFSYIDPQKETSMFE